MVFEKIKYYFIYKINRAFKFLQQIESKLKCLRAELKSIKITCFFQKNFFNGL